MNKYFILIVMYCVLTSCHKPSNEPKKCFFIGKWCVWDSTKNMCLNTSNGMLITEFKLDGEYTHSFFKKGQNYIWHSDNCTDIDINLESGSGFGNIKIEKISNDIIILNDFYQFGSMVNHRL